MISSPLEAEVTNEVSFNLRGPTCAIPESNGQFAVRQGPYRSTSLFSSFTPNLNAEAATFAAILTGASSSSTRFLSVAEILLQNAC
jgi:hypothetical protein